MTDALQTRTSNQERNRWSYMLHRLARTRLARESAKLNPAEEKKLADEGPADTLDAWPEY